ncbi:hypothetical protein MRX96_005322 [Rhipicephalus microplus]
MRRGARRGARWRVTAVWTEEREPGKTGRRGHRRRRDPRCCSPGEARGGALITSSSGPFWRVRHFVNDGGGAPPLTPACLFGPPLSAPGEPPHVVALRRARRGPLTRCANRYTPIGGFVRSPTAGLRVTG